MLPINDTVRKLDREIAHMLLAYQGGFGFEDRLFVPSETNVEAMQSQVQSKLQEVRDAELDPFWQAHFDSVLRGLGMAVLEHTHLPYNYIHSIAGFLNNIPASSDPTDEKLSKIRGKLEKLPPVIAEVTKMLGNRLDVRRNQVKNSAQAILKVLDRVEPFIDDSKGDVSYTAFSQTKKVIADTRNIIISSQSAIDSMQAAPSPPDPIDFATVLRDGMQVPLDFILSWYLEDYQQRFEEFRELAASIDKGDPFDVLKKHSPSYTNAADLFADAKGILKTMRDAALKYVRLPEGEVCEIGPVPEQSKLDCPTAMYTGANVWTGKIKGMMGLNDDNFSAFNRAGLWGSIAHECYPGHHTNYIKAATADLPLTFKIRLPLVRTMIEGVAHRSETLMTPYYENDVARLATARRVLYCAARVKAEVDLNYHKKSPEEIIKMYREDMKLNEMSARLQVQAHLMYPGDAISYYTGARVLETRRKELGMDSIGFTEPIFSFGFLSVNTMRDIVALSPKDWGNLKQFNRR